MRYMLVILFVLGLNPVAHSAVIDTLYSTGVDSLGNALALGSADPNYTVLESGTDAQVLTSLPSTYLPNNADSQWIWQQSNGTPINVIRTFRTTFDLTGFDINTVVIDGLWGTDNIGVDILINGISTGNSLPGVLVSNFSQLSSFQIADGFLSGINTLDFIIQDVGSIAGFRAELSGSDSVSTVPVPAAAWLFGTGLLGLFGVMKRRKA